MTRTWWCLPNMVTVTPLSQSVPLHHRVRFSGEAQQREYEAWLGGFPHDDLLAIQPIAELARTETAALKAEHGEEKDIATIMKRPHIVAAIELGRTRPLVQAFNALVIRLNVARLQAIKSGMDDAIRRAQEPLTDLGKALRNVLKALSPLPPNI